MTYVFIFLAAVLNAFMDTIENENFFVSKFSNLNQKFWYKRRSWQFAIGFLGYKLDAWHIAKSLMIIMWALALVTFEGSAIWGFISAGVVWNVTFNVFYYKVFR